MKGTPLGWLEHSPVVSCTDNQVLAQLNDLGSKPQHNQICANAANVTLMSTPDYIAPLHHPCV